jgi:hypothetical protein
VFVTGYADADAIERAAGPETAVLRKPFRINEMQAAIADALKVHNPTPGSNAALGPG